MPHIVIEYSANLRARLDLPHFLQAVHAAALSTGVFPAGGIRTRAYEAEHYVIADGHPDNTFVHIGLRIGPGRALDTRKRACETIFAAARNCLAALYETLPIGISLDMQDIDPVLRYRQNNLHEYVARRHSHEGAP